MMSLAVLALVLLLLMGVLPIVSAADTEKPYVTDFTPYDGANGVVVNALISITFSEDVKSSNLDNHITMKDGRGFQVEKTISYANYTYKAIITPDEPLKFSMLYVVTVSPFIQDLVGNPLREPIQWTFNTTKEKTPPTVVSTTPLDKVNDVPINSTVTVVFSEEMDIDSLETGIVVHDALENPVIGNTTPTEDGMSLTFDPLFSYGYGDSYRVTVLMTVKDMAGNTMVDDYIFQFTVQLERIPPRMVAIEPADESQFVNRTTRVKVTFSEPMNSTSLAGAVVIQDPDFEEIPTTPQYNAEDYTLIVKPDLPLDYETLYTVIVKDVAKDLAGNLLEKVYSITFTTEKLPQASPHITGRLPMEEQFQLYEGLQVTFTVVADDPNGDILVYSWEVNDEVQEGETFNEFTFYPEPGSEGAYKIDVQVLDGITAPARSQWIVNVVRTTTGDNGDTESGSFNWAYMAIIITLVIIFAFLAVGYMGLMDRKREILARTRRRLRPLSFKRTKVEEKPPTYEEMYLRPDGVYTKKSPEFKPIDAPEGGMVKGKVGAEATVDTAPTMGDAPQLIEAKEVQVETAKVGPYSTPAPELKKTRAPGAMVCPKCGRKAIEAAHGRLWCDTCGFVE
jgi:methionine-rich copper-binding protein CopC